LRSQSNIDSSSSESHSEDDCGSFSNEHSGHLDEDHSKLSEEIGMFLQKKTNLKRWNGNDLI